MPPDTRSYVFALDKVAGKNFDSKWTGDLYFADAKQSK